MLVPTATKAIRIGQTLKFLPQHFKVPGTTPTDQLAIASGHLTDALRDLSNNRVVVPFPQMKMEALKTLRDIFKTEVGNPSNDEPYEEPTTNLQTRTTSFCMKPWRWT